MIMSCGDGQRFPVEIFDLIVDSIQDINGGRPRHIFREVKLSTWRKNSISQVNTFFELLTWEPNNAGAAGGILRIASIVKYFRLNYSEPQTSEVAIDDVVISIPQALRRQNLGIEPVYPAAQIDYHHVFFEDDYKRIAPLLSRAEETLEDVKIIYGDDMDHPVSPPATVDLGGMKRLKNLTLDSFEEDVGAVLRDYNLLLGQLTTLATLETLNLHVPLDIHGKDHLTALAPLFQSLGAAWVPLRTVTSGQHPTISYPPPSPSWD
ncbi:hypothetical protein NLJ89_g7639 [Agrocybe chaxingu]|uniref:Uncharacterized protein n=1 Tax=Agrocybe chaxingu TaxID=84603 RepID=A0A9W8JU73_9AGAR|nr:hypothetical protein NLJ89_g7639 [Agrocybe chaxingu]